MAARADSVSRELDSADAAARSAWAAGFGIVSPDVTRYVDVVRAMPDALLLATRNLTEEQELPLIDADAAQLICSMLRMRHSQRVLELGAGAGYLTVQLARALDADSTLISTEAHPIRHGQVHAFLGHASADCTVELRLAEPDRLVASLEEPLDAVVFGDPRMDRIALLDAVRPRLAPDALVFAPFALRGGRAADPLNAWGDDVEQQRSFNRAVANDARFVDTQLLTIGDGLLLARRG